MRGYTCLYRPEPDYAMCSYYKKLKDLFAAWKVKSLKEFEVIHWDWRIELHKFKMIESHWDEFRPAKFNPKASIYLVKVISGEDRIQVN